MSIFPEIVQRKLRNTDPDDTPVTIETAGHNNEMLVLTMGFDAPGETKIAVTLAMQEAMDLRDVIYDWCLRVPR